MMYLDDTKHNCCQIWPSGLPVWIFFSWLFHLAGSAHLPSFISPFFRCPSAYHCYQSHSCLGFHRFIGPTPPPSQLIPTTPCPVLNPNCIHSSSVLVLPILSWEMYGIWKSTIRNSLLWKFIIVKIFTLILLKHKLLHILFNIYIKYHHC